MKYYLKFYINKFLYAITKNPKYNYKTKMYYHIRFRKNNRIIIVENGVNKVYPITEYIEGVDIVWKGDNNTLIIGESSNLAGSKISFLGNNNVISFGKICYGCFKLVTFGDNCTIKFGNRVESSGIRVHLHPGDKFTMGDNCMLAMNIFCCTDGHSILDCNNYELLNKPPYHVEIGNHVWLGRNVTLLKSASIPDNCVVGINATVTKHFNKQNCVIAGNPAKIVKENINWNGCMPSEYDKNTIDRTF